MSNKKLPIYVAVGLCLCYGVYLAVGGLSAREKANEIDEDRTSVMEAAKEAQQAGNTPEAMDKLGEVVDDITEPPATTEETD